MEFLSILRVVSYIERIDIKLISLEHLSLLNLLLRKNKILKYKNTDYSTNRLQLETLLNH